MKASGSINNKKFPTLFSLTINISVTNNRMTFFICIHREQTTKADKSDPSHMATFFPTQSRLLLTIIDENHWKINKNVQATFYLAKGKRHHKKWQIFVEFWELFHGDIK